jgi:two-component system phosphate regulon sensor histidine kinase PhoR
VAILWYLIGLVTAASFFIWRQRQFEGRILSLVKARSWSSALLRLQELLADQPEQQQQLQFLGNRRDTLEYILQVAPVGYLQVDDENRLIWCNNEANRLLRMNQPSMGSVQRRRLLLEVARSYELDALIDEARQCQVPCQREWMLYQISPDPIHPKEEPTYPLRGYAIPLHRSEVGVFLENRQEVTLLLQQRDRWTSDVAHELKTPLTSIRLVAETLQSRVESETKVWLDRLVNETIRLSHLVEDLLNLSRLQANPSQGLARRPVDLPTLIYSAWQSLEPLAQVKRLTLHYQGPEHRWANLDEALFLRVVLNLIDNAIKHSPPQTQIYVKVSSPTPAADAPELGGFILEVIDQGSGFNSKDLPYIFDRFYRADPSRSRSQPTVDADSPIATSRGNGLGLAIVNQIVAAHGGTIKAVNHPDLGGGWLTLEIPADPESETPT